MASVDPRIKQLKIKTGVVNRLAKEKSAYEKEVLKQEERIAKMKSEGKDEYDIRKQEEVLQESVMMIPDSKRRLGIAWEDLKNLVDQSEDLKETEEYEKASTTLADSKEAAGK